MVDNIVAVPTGVTESEEHCPQPFSENPPPTMRHLANEPPRDDAEPYFLACIGKSATRLS